MQADLIGQGLELMLYGMGTVVTFLALLVLATTLMSRGINRFFPQPAAEPHATGVIERGGVQDDPNLVAVISAAIHQHRLNRK